MGRTFTSRDRYWRLHPKFEARLQASSRRALVPSEPSTAIRGHARRPHVLRRASAVGYYPLSMLEVAPSVKIASAAAHTKAAHHSRSTWWRRHRRGENVRSLRAAGLLLRGTP